VRDEVLNMKARANTFETPLPRGYSCDELSNIDDLLDASPSTIANLRQHSFTTRGRGYDYGAGDEGLRRQFAAKLAALREVGRPELFVPEPGALGGTGFEIDGVLVNIDTLMFYEALIALDRAEVMSEIAVAERVVVEIGGGWGGFAYQLKTLYPELTCVIVDLPELLLCSAVYLMSTVPNARVAFWDGISHPQLAVGLDFLFVASAELRTLPLERVDLVVNIASFEEMTSDQVREYVDWAHEREAPYLYSLNRDRSPLNVELTSVRDVVRTRYWPMEIAVLPVAYDEMLPRSRPDKPRVGRDDPAADGANRYRHVVARRRLLLDDANA
jgi:putative sugar O-methyltransferase